jgi:hypothetical protein
MRKVNEGEKSIHAVVDVETHNLLKGYSEKTGIKLQRIFEKAIKEFIENNKGDE